MASAEIPGAFGARSRPLLFALGMARSKDSTYLFQPPLQAGAISQWAWRFLTYRLTQAGRWLLIITVLIAGAGSNSLDAQFYVVFNYLAGLWAIGILCVIVLRPRADVQARHADRIGVGETLTVDLTVTQKRGTAFAPLVVVPNRLPPSLDAEPVEGAALPPLGRGETAHAVVRLQCRRRGVHTWEGFRVETSFPFGLLRSHRTCAQPRRVLVYPRFTPLASLDTPSGTRYQPGGVELASTLGEAVEYVGNREYREGDSIRGIDWRATARLNLPIVREYREEYFLRVGVILDTQVPGRTRPADLDNFERAVSVCASVSEFMARADYLVDIFAAGATLYHLTAGRSLAYLDQILDILACVESSPEEPFAILEPAILQYLSRITSIICVFMDWDEPRRAFVDGLRREGAGVKVVVVRDGPCTLDPGGAALGAHIRVVSAADFAAGVREL